MKNGNGAIFRHAREAQGLTCYAVAQAAGIPNSGTVRAIENGQHAKLSSLEAIAKVLGCPITSCLLPPRRSRLMPASYKTPNKAIEKIQSLPIPTEGILRIWADEIGDTCLQMQVSYPYGFFDFFSEPLTGTGAWTRAQSCLPLFESDTNIFCLDEGTGTFLCWNCEDDTIREMGDTYQRFIASFLTRFIEAGFSDEALAEIGSFFEFEFIEKIISFACGKYHREEDKNIKDSTKRYYAPLRRLLKEIS